MNLNAVRDYLRNLGDNYATLDPRDNYVKLFSVNGVFDVSLSILKNGIGVYNGPCIRFYIYSYRRPENGSIMRDTIWLGAIGFWLRKRFKDYLLLNQTNLDS